MTDERTIGREGSSPTIRADAPAGAEARSRVGVEELSIRLSIATGRLIRLLRRQAPTEIGPGSLSVLGTLSRSGPMRLRDLATREGVAPPTLTRIVAVLEDAGYVCRRTDEHDRRAVRVSVTESGRRVVDDTFAARAAIVRARLAQVSDADRQALVDALPAFEALTGEVG